MFNALFESSDFKLRGPKEHKLLIQSLMNGSDLYSPVEINDDPEEIDGEEKPFDRLYQAQLLKDHAMAHKVTNIMLDQPSSDRYLVIAGYGHLALKRKRLGFRAAEQHQHHLAHRQPGARRGRPSPRTAIASAPVAHPRRGTAAFFIF